MGRRDYDEIGADLLAALGAHQPGCAGAANLSHDIRRVAYAPRGEVRAQRFIDVAAKVLPARKCVAADPCLQVSFEHAGRLEPAREMRVVVRQQGHARGRDVGAVRAIETAIGEARAETRTRLKDADARRRAGAGKMVGDRGAGKSATNDRHYRRRRAHD